MQQNNKHILYLSYDGMTDPLGQSQVLAYLEGLSKLNYRFTLISFEKAERFKKEEKVIEKRCQISNIKWLPLHYTKKPPILSTVYDILILKQKVLEVFKEDSFAIIHCRSYITAIIGLEFKRSYGIKFVFDMRGFYADERVDGKIWNLENPIFKAVYKFFKYKEIQFLNEADYVISLTQAGKNIIHSWRNIANQPIPIQVIPCCANLEMFSNEGIEDDAKVKLSKSLEITKNDFVLSYLGSIGTWYMLNEMLDFFKILKEENPRSIFLFITNEPSEYITEVAKVKGIAASDLRIVSSPHKLVPLHLSISDAGIFFIQPVFSKQASSPTKQAELMGMNLLHVCNKGVGDVDAIVAQTNCGVVVENFKEEEYRIAAKELLKRVKQQHGNIREQAFGIYSLQKGIERYAEVYNNLLLGKSPS